MKVCLEWVKDFVKVSAKPGSLADRLTLTGLETHLSEEGNETALTVLDTEVTSNRADWLSHLGVAREIAAVFGGKLKKPPARFPRKKKPWQVSNERIGVRIEDKKRCLYYSCVVLEGVQDQPSPKFIQDRLIACGLRPVSLVVDVTNYVLLETGQPLHAFDLDLLSGREIIVRTAKAGEKLTAIDGKEYALTPEDLVIADSTHPVAVAGVMGGIESEFSRKTNRVLLESAYFQPRTVRISSRRLALASESSYRFERGVDPLGVDEARDRAVYLIAKYGSLAKVSRVYRAGNPNYRSRKIILDLEEAEKILGLAVPIVAVRRILTGLGLSLRPKRKNVIEVTVPSFRPDLIHPIDLIEEIIRIYGYDRIPETIPTGVLPATSESRILELEDLVRDTLVGAGFFEAVSFSLENAEFLDRLGLLLPGATTITNPQNKELTVMRPFLLPGLLRAFALNADHGREEIRLFEVACTYGPEEGSRPPSEDVHVACLVAGKTDVGWGNSNRKASFFDLKGVVEMLLDTLKVSDFEFQPFSHKLLAEGEALQIRVGGRQVGFMGALGWDAQTLLGIKETGWVAEINLSQLTANSGEIVKYLQPNKFPSAKRDIALIVKEEITSRSISEKILDAGGSFIRSVSVFDVFQGGSIPKGFKSLAFSVEYGSEERTLTSDEVNNLHKKIGSVLIETFQAQIR